LPPLEPVYTFLPLYSPVTLSGFFGAFSLDSLNVGALVMFFLVVFETVSFLAAILLQLFSFLS